MAKRTYTHGGGFRSSSSSGSPRAPHIPPPGWSWDAPTIHLPVPLPDTSSSAVNAIPDITSGGGRGQYWKRPWSYTYEDWRPDARGGFRAGAGGGPTEYRGGGAGGDPPPGDTGAPAAAAPLGDDSSALVEAIRSLIAALEKSTSATEPSERTEQMGALKHYYGEAEKIDRFDVGAGWPFSKFRKEKSRMLDRSVGAFNRAFEGKDPEDGEPADELWRDQQWADTKKYDRKLRNLGERYKKSQSRWKLTAMGVSAGLQTAGAMLSQYAAQDYRTTDFESNTNIEKAAFQTGGSALGAMLGAMAGTAIMGPGWGTLVGMQMGGSAGGAVGSTFASGVQATAQPTLDVVAATKHSVAETLSLYDRLNISYSDDFLKSIALNHMRVAERVVIGMEAQTTEIGKLQKSRAKQFKERRDAQKGGDSIRNTFNDIYYAIWGEDMP